MAQIVIENAAKDYRVGRETICAVRSASLAVDQGAFVSIVGHSGSGKTTLLSMIGGLAAPTGGRVLFQGDDIYAWGSDRLAEYRSARVGFMFQSASLLPVLTARENLLLAAAFHPEAPAEADQGRHAEELLSAVGLADKINAYPARLSGGQQRRVAIARAFMNRPSLILADEPTGDLDEDTEAEMMSFFLRMNSDQGTTFILVTHNSELAAQARQRIRMHRGVLTAE